MRYSSLFNLIHSNTLSESVKEDILSKVLDRVAEADEDLLAESLNEGEDNIAAYVEALSLLVNSDITNEALEEAIDTIFANESQETVDRVEEAFKEDVVKGILVEQLLIEEGLDEGWFDGKDNRPIGLAGIRKAAGEEPIKKKPQPQQAPKKEPIKSTPFKGDKGVNVVKSADGTYRSANTSGVKAAAVNARKQRQQERVNANKAKTEAKLNKTGSTEPIINDTSRLKKEAETKQANAKVQNKEARLKANAEKTAAKLSKIGSTEPIIDDTARLKKEAKKKQIKAIAKQAKEKGLLDSAVKNATSKRKERNGEGSTRSNVLKGIGGGFKYSDAVQAKLDKVKGNKGATKAIENSDQAKSEREAAKKPSKKSTVTKTTKRASKKEDNGQLKLNLDNKEPKNEEVKAPKKTVKKETKTKTPKPPVKKEVKKESTKEGVKEETSTEDTSKTNTQKKPSVYIKGGSSTPKKKNENFNSSSLDQEIYSARKDALDAKGTPEYAELHKRYKELKAKKEAMNATEALVTLFKANLSEGTLKDICEMVAANKKNAEKVLKRNEERLTAAVNDIHNDLAKTRQTNPNLVSKAEALLKRKEATERRFDNKFNKKK